MVRKISNIRSSKHACPHTNVVAARVQSIKSMIQHALCVAVLGLWALGSAQAVPVHAVHTTAHASTTAKAITFANEKTSVVVQQTQSRVLTLYIKSNATTGYNWFLKQYPHRWLRPMSRLYVAPTGRLIGAPGYAIWRFKVLDEAFVVPRITHITFTHSRAWDPSDQEDMRLTVYILPKSMSS